MLKTKNNWPFITKKQNKLIKDYLVSTWDSIYDKILTSQQRKLMKKDKDFQKNICFDMEEYYKSMADEFGLTALLDE
jgi:hypothetical protein